MKLKNLLILSLFFCVTSTTPGPIYLGVEPGKSPFSPNDLGTILMPYIQNSTPELYQVTTKDGTVVSIMPNKFNNMFQVSPQMPTLSNLATGNKIEFKPTTGSYSKATLTWQANQIKLESTSASLNLTTVVNVSALMRYITYYYQPFKGRISIGKHLSFMGNPVAFSLYLKFEAADVKVYAIVLTTTNPDFNTPGSKYRGQSYRNWIFTKNELDKNTNSQGIITEVYDFN